MSITLRSRRGPIGKSWHAAALREALEMILGVGRAAGGKAAARSGRVQWIDITAGVVRGDVMGEDGTLQQARIDLPPFPSADREAFTLVARSHPGLAATLAAGEYPQAIEAELARSEVSLLPRGPSELSHDCSCLDWPGPCRHVAALAYVLVEAVDDHPLQLLTLRGLTLDDLVVPAEPELPASPGFPEPGPALPSTLDPATRFDPERADPTLLAAVIGPAAAVVHRFFTAAEKPLE